MKRRRSEDVLVPFLMHNRDLLLPIIARLDKWADVAHLFATCKQMRQRGNGIWKILLNHFYPLCHQIQLAQWPLENQFLYFQCVLLAAHLKYRKGRQYYVTIDKQWDVAIHDDTLIVSENTPRGLPEKVIEILNDAEWWRHFRQEDQKTACAFVPMEQRSAEDLLNGLYNFSILHKVRLWDAFLRIH